MKHPICSLELDSNLHDLCPFGVFHKSFSSIESDGGANDAENGHDLSLWENIQKLGKSIGNSKNVSPRFLVAGGGLFMTLSNWGLLPQVSSFGFAFTNKTIG